MEHHFCFVVADLNSTSGYTALRYSHLDYTLAVHLPWEDFAPLGKVDLPASNITQTNGSPATALRIAAANLCASSLPMTVGALTSTEELTPLLQVHTANLLIFFTVFPCICAGWSMFVGCLRHVCMFSSHCGWYRFRNHARCCHTRL